MAFWGVEVKNGKSVTHHYDHEKGRLHLTQATLGFGSSDKRSVVQCNVGDRPGVLLCSLLPGKMETCSLNLEFEEEEEVIFSVLGPTSIHLCGHYKPPNEPYDSDTHGEDISGASEDFSDDSSEEEYEDDFIDDDDVMLSSRLSNPGVKIEEIEDGEPSKENSQDVLRKKKKGKAIVPTNGPALDSKVEAGSKTVVDGIKDESNGKLTEEGNGGGSESEEEDEDGFLVPHKREKSGNTMKKKKEKKMITPRNEATVDGKDESGGKTAADGIKNESGEKLTEEGNQGGPESKNEDEDEDGLPVPPKRKNSGNSQNEPPKKKQVKEGNVNDATDPAAAEQALPDVPKETKKSKKKKKKAKNKENEKRNTAETEGANGTSNEDNTDSLTMTEEKPALVEEKVQGKESSNNVRTFPNGLVIEELSMGKPDGKKAAPGNKVSMYYTGKLKQNGKIFDSNIGRKPFLFRLGVGEVISGWDVGVKGMRVGDKRRLTIPPAMGYGAKGIGGIPGNAWLVFDVELVNVK